VDEQVVVEGTDRLRDGMAVRVAAPEQVKKEVSEETGTKPFGQGDAAPGKDGAAQ